MNPDMIEAGILKAIITSDNIKLKQYSNILKTAIVSRDEYFSKYFKFLLQLLNKEAFLKLEAASDFFFVFKNCRELLSDSLKLKFLPLIESVYKEFGELSLYQIEEGIYQAIINKDEKQIIKCAYELDKSLFGVDNFPEEVFQFFIGLLNLQDFLELKGSWHLLTFLENNWTYISNSQKNTLLSSLEIAYSKFQDWMSHFVISELLGEYFADQRAFDVLCRLKTLESEGCRSFVPHGLEHIIRDSKDDNLSKEACFHLLQMKNDSSEKVRGEVDESLRRLQNQGLQCN